MKQLASVVHYFTERFGLNLPSYHLPLNSERCSEHCRREVSEPGKQGVERVCCAV